MGQVCMIYTHPIYRQRGANTTSTPDMCKSVAGSKKGKRVHLGQMQLLSVWVETNLPNWHDCLAKPLLCPCWPHHLPGTHEMEELHQEFQSNATCLPKSISLWSTVPSPISFLPTTSTRWLGGLIRIYSSPRHYISFHCFSVWSHRDYQATSTSHGDLILRIPLHPFAWEIPRDGTKAGICNVIILVEGKQNLNRTTKKKLTIPTSGTSFRGYLHVRCSFSYVISIKSIMCKWKANGQNSKMKKYEKCQSFGQSWARFNTAGHRRHWMVTGLGL